MATIVQSKVSWGGNDKAAITACVKALKANGGRISALRFYKEAYPKATMGGLNAVFKSIITKCGLVLDGGEKTRKFKDEVGNVLEDLTTTEVYVKETDTAARNIAEQFQKIAMMFYVPAKRGKKSTSTNELAELFGAALKDLFAEESADESETEEESETEDETVQTEVVA